MYSRGGFSAGSEEFANRILMEWRVRGGFRGLYEKLDAIGGGYARADENGLIVIRKTACALQAPGGFQCRLCREAGFSQLADFGHLILTAAAVGCAVISADTGVAHDARTGLRAIAVCNNRVGRIDDEVFLLMVILVAVGFYPDTADFEIRGDMRAFAQAAGFVDPGHALDAGPGLHRAIDERISQCLEPLC